MRDWHCGDGSVARLINTAKAVVETFAPMRPPLHEMAFDGEFHHRMAISAALEALDELEDATEQLYPVDDDD